MCATADARKCAASSAISELQKALQLYSATPSNRSLAESAVEAARQVVRSELAVRPELVAAVAQEAVEALLLSARHITVRVHPLDLPLVTGRAAGR